MSHSPLAPHQHSLAFARNRDTRILRLLDGHPVLVAQLVSLGWFPNCGKALKRLRRLAERRRIRLVGTVSRKAGRPEHVFCRWRPKPDQLLHEVELTELCLRLHAGRIRRGPQLDGSDLRPDAEIEINGELLYVELDRGTEGFRQLRGRFRLYEGTTKCVLWVCPTAARRDGLRRQVGDLLPNALFATFAEAVADPHRGIWVDCRGACSALPRQRVGILPAV